MIDALETVGRPPAAAPLKRIESPWKIPEAERILALLVEMTKAEPLPKPVTPANGGGDGFGTPPAPTRGAALHGSFGASPPAAGAASALGTWGAEAVGAFFGKVNWKNERRTLAAPAAPPVVAAIEEAAALAFDGAVPLGRQSVRQFFFHANWRNQTTVAEPVVEAPDPIVPPQRTGAADRLAATSVLASFQWD